MKQAWLMLPFCLLLALPATAQRNKKPKQTSVERPKDDKHTGKDKAIKAIDKFIKKKGKPSKSKDWRTRLRKPEVLEFDSKSDYLWKMKTNKGDITIRLMPETAPMHVSSTIYLARTGFYDGLTFHRVVKGFMAQGGCPAGTGNGGPGYAYDGEFDDDVKHDRPGLLSMAHAGPGTDGSQFFLTFVKTPHLDGLHTIFGEVIEGMNTLKELEKCGGTGGRGKTTEKLTTDLTWIVVAPKPKAKAGQAKKGKD